MRKLLIAAALVLLGAGCMASTPTKPAPTPAAPPQVGQNCGPGDSCPNGTQCVKYYGIAGPNGPEFKSCEIPCGDAKACPSGLSCVTIADGPGAVCR